MYKNRLDDMINDERIRQELRKAPRGQLAHEFEVQNAKSRPLLRQHPRVIAFAIVVVVIVFALLNPQITLAQEEIPNFQSGDLSSEGNQGDVWYGILLLRLEQYSQAVEVFTEALAIDPGQPSALAARAIAYYRLADYDQAVADSLAALAIAPDYTTPYWTLGHVYFAEGDYPEAITHYERYLALAGEDADFAVIERLEQCREFAQIADAAG